VNQHRTTIYGTTRHTATWNIVLYQHYSANKGRPTNNSSVPVQRRLQGRLRTAAETTAKQHIIEG
jgi:hypothetical protein